MRLSFEVEIAKKYGISKAIFIDNLYFWILKNEANGRHCYDGKTWTYNTIEAYKKLFNGIFSNRQLERITKSLEDNGAIHTGNFNKRALDRTKWYSLSDEILRFYQTVNTISLNGEMDFTKQGNAFHQTVEAIPYSNTDSNTDINNKPPIIPRWKKTLLGGMLESSNLPLQVKSHLFEWLDYKNYNYSEIGFKKLLTIAISNTNEYGSDTVCELINECMGNMWEGIIWRILKKNTYKKTGQSAKPDKTYTSDELNAMFDRADNEI